MPPELQRRVVDEVELAKRRSQMDVNDSLMHLGVARGTYYRWKKERAWERERIETAAPVQAFEALVEEKQAVIGYALKHPEIRHRELSWRMIDEDVAYLSASTVYRILRDNLLMHCHRGREKRYRSESEKASCADAIWATDLVYIKVGGVQYYLVTFIDEYSRYLLHWELLSSMDGHSISTAAQRAIETIALGCNGQPEANPVIRSDNGSGYISSEFVGLLSHHNLTHHRIRPHCPEENGIQERFNRTLREGIEDHELNDRYQTEEVIGNLITHYNEVRLHSSLGFQTPATWYRGDPSVVERARRQKLSQARHRRRQVNLGIVQPTLPLITP